MKPLIICLTFMLCYIMAQQPNPESNKAAYIAYLTQDPKAMKTKWKTLVEAANNKSQASTNTDLLYQLALAQFGLLTGTMRDQDEELFDLYADETEENLESLIAQNKKWGEPRALLSALLGLKMGYSPIKGMFLGPKSQSLMEQAIKDSPSSPLVWKLYANSKFFTPETFGGDTNEAIKAWEKSIELYEASPENTTYNWFYLDALAFLGQAYVKNGQSSKAIATYEKALNIEPDFLWVKLNLLPRAKKSNTTN